jgi:DUF1009 family protein
MTVATGAAPATAEAGTGRPLALVAGGGAMPMAVAEAAQRSGRSVIILALAGIADPTWVTRYRHHWLSLGRYSRFKRLMRAEQCTDVVLIGSMVRPSIWRLRIDGGSLAVLPRIAAAFRGGDNHLLSGLARILEEDGFHLLGAHDVAPDILVPEGVLTRRTPSQRDHEDIAQGFALLQATGPFDIGQGAVVADRNVVAVEGAEGTDGMLARLLDMRRAGRVSFGDGRGVLVKAAKPGQDRRFDLPTVGPKTVEAAARAGLAGIAVAAGDTIGAEQQQMIAAADRAGLFIAGIKAAR